MRFLGIDYGSKRVGLALSDESGRLAFPHEVLDNDEQLTPAIIQLCGDKRVEQIVIGESLNYQGKGNPIMKRVTTFREELAKALPKTPIYMEQETLTSAAALRTQTRRPLRPNRSEKKNKIVDDSAAALILQTHLDRQVSKL
ncbi:MAG: Holliday junction resolvase RuvX [Patescibacteria group bacterium]|nr:Holliday junction resolvase RuvX [Patescibacteria group bacterium]